MGDTDLDTVLAKIAATPRRHVPASVGSGTERYEFRKQLGRGAFGDVYEARDRHNGAIVAIKRLKGPDPGWVYRFKREYRVVADMSHPNIVRFYELFFEDDHWYLTMELVRGRPFGEHLARAPEDLRSCFTQLAVAISALHRSGCLHRDIKPSNALVEPTGRVVLLDFGLAREQDSYLATAVAGTPPYMAPELGMRDEPSEASDWYAFGAMLFESLTGRLPFNGTESQIFQLKLGGPPELDTSPSPDADLEALALALLSPAPEDRPIGEQVLARLAALPREQSGRGPAEPFALPLVGREGELHQMFDALERSRRDTVLVTLHGDPGMGKSSLAQEFCSRAVEQRAKVYTGRCRETESLPFKGIDGVIDTLCADLLSLPDDEVAAVAPSEVGALLQMFPVFKRVPEFARMTRRESGVHTPHTARRAARAALRDMLTRIASWDPVVLFVDDLQWANDDSIGLLLDLLAPPAPPMLVLVAFRREAQGSGGPLDQFLMSMVGRPGFVRVDVPVKPLDEEGVRQLIEAQPSESIDAARAIRETGGHPYLLSRLVGAGRLSEAEGFDLSAVLGAQIAALSKEARQLLEVVSLSASPLRQHAAFAITGDPWNSIVVGELRRERLVQCSNSTADGIIEPYHARVRESVLEQLDAKRRRELHEKIASYLETRGRADPEALVYHYRNAGLNAEALAWTRKAARNARDAFAFGRAAELFADAVDLAEGDEDRIALLVELAEAQVQAGQRAAAGRSYVSAAQVASVIGDDVVEVAMRTRAGQHFLLAGHISKGVGLLADTLGAIGVELPADTATAVASTITLGAALATRGLAFTPVTEQQAGAEALRRLDLELAVARALANSDVRASWAATKALFDAVEVGEPRRVQRAMASYLVSNAARAPEHPLIIECTERSRQLANELDDDLGRAWSCFGWGLWKMQLGEYHAAIAELKDARLRFLATNSQEYVREAATAHVMVVGLLAGMGIDVKGAQRQHARTLEDAVERDDRFVANWARTAHTWVHLSLDDVETARKNLELVRIEWPAANEDTFAALTIASEAAAAVYEDPVAAADSIEAALPSYRELYASLIPVTRSVLFRMRASSALALLLAGKVPRDRAIARIEESLEAVQSWAYALPAHRAVEASLFAARGDRAGYEERMDAARREWDARDQPGLMMMARLRLEQVRGETQQVAATVAEARAFGLRDPDRYAWLFVGPNMAGRF